jgi:hypothetical protein
VDRNVTLNYSSTLEGSRSVLVLTCDSDIPESIIKQIVTVTCHSSGNWIPDPAQFILVHHLQLYHQVQKY